MLSEQRRKCPTSFNRGEAGNREHRKRGTRYIFRYSSKFRVPESLSKLLR
jgi:hypothetical protein